MASWDKLLSLVAHEHALRCAHHDDPAATWESLLVEAASNRNIQAAEAEKVLLKSACALMTNDLYDDDILSNLGHRISERYRDILSLNVDDTLSRAFKRISGQAGSWCAGSGLGRFAGSLTGRMTHEVGDHCIRVWYPHGIVRRPTRIILGTRNYGTLLKDLSDGLSRMKEWEKRFAPRSRAAVASSRSQARWRALTRKVLAAADPETWLHSFMIADLVFIGAGLNRAETDLWWLLHQRQRNLARVDPDLRPRTFFVGVCAAASPPAHVCTGPAGIITVSFRSHDDAWSAVLGGSLHT